MRIHDSVDGRTPGAITDATRRLEEGGWIVLRFLGPERPAGTVLECINELAQHFGKRLRVYFYDDVPIPFDARILGKLTDVCDLMLSCSEVLHPTFLSGLERLETFYCSYRETSPPDALLDVLNPRSLRALRLRAEGRTLDLSGIGKFTELRTLGAGGRRFRGLEELVGHPYLETLALGPVGNVRLDFVSQIPRLRNLGLGLGGRKRADDVESSTVVELRLDGRGLIELPDLSRFPQLRELHLEDLPRLERIDLPPLRHLNQLQVHLCRRLQALTGLVDQGRLEHLRISQTQLDLDALLASKLPSSLDIFAFYIDPGATEQKAQARLTELGFRHGLDEDPSD